MMKPSTDYIWFALLAAFLLLASGCASKEEKTTYKRDTWSLNCPEGAYSVVSDEDGYVCSPLRSCVDDDDCVYLQLDKVPPRVGKCVENKCKAYCGSGDPWEC
jgi:hypothetical protein